MGILVHSLMQGEDKVYDKVGLKALHTSTK
jgi:hypothetical protein